MITVTFTLQDDPSTYTFDAIDQEIAEAHVNYYADIMGPLETIEYSTSTTEN